MVDGGFLAGILDHQKQIQPNALDFDIKKIHKFADTSTPFVISEATKQMRKLVELDIESDGYWHLTPNSEYDITSNVIVSVPEGYGALLVLRSTFVRNGCWLASGLYDQGFQGSLGCTLHTGSAPVLVAPNTRVGQIMFIHSNTTGGTMYAGGYNSTADKHWSAK